jgi:hypothetical protein
VDLVRYTVEQRVFLCESYVKCDSARKCRRKFRRSFTRITVPSTTDIHKLINKVRSTGSLLDKKPAKKKPCAYRRKTRRDRGQVRTHTTEIIETPCTRDRHLEIVSRQSEESVNLILFKCYRERVRVLGHNFQHLLQHRQVYFIVFMERYVIHIGKIL